MLLGYCSILISQKLFRSEIDISTDTVDLTEPKSQFGSDFLLTSPALGDGSFPDICTDIVGLTEPESQLCSDFPLVAVSIGDDALCFEKHYTHAKRCLDADFEACQMESSTRKLKSASSSKLKADALGEDGDEMK